MAAKARRTRNTKTPEGAEPPNVAVPLGGPLLCLDVSSIACGWVAFRPDGTAIDFGVIRPRAKLPSVERTDSIVRGVRDLHGHYLPALALMEWSAGLTHGRIAKARGPALPGRDRGGKYLDEWSAQVQAGKSRGHDRPPVSGLPDGGEGSGR
jgi:hypothetical protein